MRNRSKPVVGRGRAATTLAPCPSCFAMIAAPFLSWHLAKCPNPSDVPKPVDSDLAPVTPIKREVDETKHRFSEVENFFPVKREMGETNHWSSVPDTFVSIKREASETNLCSSSLETLVPIQTQGAKTSKASAHQTSILHAQLYGLTSESVCHAQAEKESSPEKVAVSKSSDMPSVDTTGGFDFQNAILEAQRLKVATPIVTRDSDECSRKLKELELKYNELLKREEDLQRQLRQAKESEKEAWNMVDTLRAELHGKGGSGRAARRFKMVDIVDLEGGSWHSDTAGFDTVTRVIPSFKENCERDVSPKLENTLATLTSQNIDRSPEFVSQVNRNPEEALPPKFNAGNASKIGAINIDAVRGSDGTNGGSDSYCKIQMDQCSHSVPVPKVSEKREMQDGVQSGRMSRIASIKPGIATEAVALANQSPLISGERRESLNSSRNNVSDNMGDLARHVQGSEKTQAFCHGQDPEYKVLRQLFSDGDASQSHTALDSCTSAPNEIQAVPIPNATDRTGERGIVSNLCQSISVVGKAKAARGEVGKENIFYSESQQLMQPENKFLNRETDLSTHEHCGLPLSQSCIVNQVNASVSSASDESGLVIKKAKSRVRPDVIMSDSESERGCVQGVAATSHRAKSLCGLASQVVEAVHLGIDEYRHIEGGADGQSDQLVQVVVQSPIGGQKQEFVSREMGGKLSNRRRAKLVKGYRKFQENQAGESCDVSRGAEAEQMKQFETKAIHLENALSASTEDKDERKREITGVRRSKRLKLKGQQKAKTGLDSSAAISWNLESMSDETKSNSFGKESSDCESISEIRGKSKGLSKARKRLFNDLPQTDRNSKRKPKINLEMKRCAGSRRHGDSLARFFVDMEGSKGSDDSQAFDENESLEGSSLDGFIVDNEESDGTLDKNDSMGSSDEKESTDGTEASGSEDSLNALPSSSLDFRKILNEKRKNYAWDFEADMLAAFAKDSDLCLRAVCALYRQQTEDEKMEGGSIHTNNRGFDRLHAARGSSIAQFLTDGDPFGPMKKFVDGLNNYDSTAVDFCRKLAFRHSKQLFEIYKYNEDPHFPYQ